MLLGRTSDAKQLLRKALATARAGGNRPKFVAAIVCRTAAALAIEGDVTGSRAGYAEALGIYKTLGAYRGTADTTSNLAELAFRSGDAETALRQASDGLAVLRERSAAGVLPTALINMSAYLIALGWYDEAEVRARDALARAREQQRDAVVAFALQHLAAVAVLRPQAKPECTRETCVRGARILGFVDGRLTALRHAARQYTEQQEYDRVLAVLRRALGTDELAKLMSDGAALTEEQAVAYALEMQDREHSAQRRRPDRSRHLVELNRARALPDHR